MKSTKTNYKKKSNKKNNVNSKKAKESGNNIIKFDNKETRRSKTIKNDYYDDERSSWLEDNLHKLVIFGIVTGIIFVLLFAMEYILEKYSVNSVVVEGNQHYTASEIRAMVEKGRLGNNTIYLSLKYKNKSITDIPFIQKMDVSVVDRNTIKISVYEKKMAGYVEYIGNYLYFDKDGIIVESSSVKTEGIPMVSGLLFDHFVMYEPLPVSNPDIFQIVLDITQLLNKYSLNVDCIYFNSNEEITLYFDDVRVGMGETNLLEEKIQRLNGILPQLEGQKGYLEMGTYDSGKEDFTFTKDKK